MLLFRHVLLALGVNGASEHLALEGLTTAPYDCMNPVVTRYDAIDRMGERTCFHLEADGNGGRHLLLDWPFT